MVLDMGRPQRIVDVARALIRMSGRTGIDISFTGLRPGEKMSEDLVARGEAATATNNPLVTGATVLPMQPNELPSHLVVHDHASAMAWSRSQALSTISGKSSEPRG